MKKIAVLLVIVLIAGAWLVFHTFLRQEARLEIENRSKDTIEDLSVAVADRRFAIGPLASGEKREIRIREYSDSAWVLSGRWKDGSPISGQFGYITHGMSFSDRLAFLPGGKIKFGSDPR